MSQVPPDALHWDSGDWIEWHRKVGNSPDAPCAASGDPEARLSALQVSLLRAARGYFDATATHLPVYDAIARVHGALRFGVPLTPDADPAIHILSLAPHGPSNIVSVDLTQAFDKLLVVRIKDNFTVEGRMIDRGKLPDTADGPYPLAWHRLPKTP